MIGLPFVSLLLVVAALSLLSTLHAALRAPSRARLAEQFERHRSATDLSRFVVRRGQFILTTGVLRSACVLFLFINVLYLFDRADSIGGDLRRIVTACLTAWSLLVVFGVAVPNAWAKYAGEWLIVRCLPVLTLLRLVCFPLIAVLGLFDPLIRRLAGVPTQDAKSFSDELEQEILHVVSEGEMHGAVDEDEKEMIESVIELTDTHVDEIMTPRTDIIAVAKDADHARVMDAIRTSGHSRIPVYDGTIDSILGIIYAKDLLLPFGERPGGERPGEGRPSEDRPFDAAAIMRRVLFIPETKPVRDLLREFQSQKVHIAVVLDEYGGTAGLVTIEDILEELVGEIADEYEADVPKEMKRIDEHTVEVDARMRIDDLNDELDLDFPTDGDFETVGGYVFSTLGRIPRVGERCEHDAVTLQVLAAEPHRILRLRLTLPQKDGEDTPRSADEAPRLANPHAAEDRRAIA